MEVYICPAYLDNVYLAWNMGITDFGIFLCYMVIPLLLLKVIKLLPKGIASELKIFGVLLSVFVISCGLTHLIKVGLIWFDLWDVMVVANYICLLASIASTLYLILYARIKLTNLAKALKDMTEAENSKDISKVINAIRSLLLNEQ